MKIVEQPYGKSFNNIRSHNFENKQHFHRIAFTGSFSET